MIDVELSELRESCGPGDRNFLRTVSFAAVPRAGDRVLVYSPDKKADQGWVSFVCASVDWFVPEHTVSGSVLVRLNLRRLA